MTGRRSRDKGARFEREVVNTFQAEGIVAERVPLSGAAGGKYIGDISVPVMGVDRTLECKKRADGFKEIYAWKADHYGVVIAADRKPALMVVTLEAFIDLVHAAEQWKRAETPGRQAEPADAQGRAA
jgi:Holliday junction resolvase